MASGKQSTGVFGSIIGNAIGQGVREAAA